MVDSKGTAQQMLGVGGQEPGSELHHERLFWTFVKHLPEGNSLRSRVLLFLAALLPLLSITLSAQSFQTLPALSFTKVYEGGNPTPQLITVASTGAPVRFSVAVVTTSGGNWLSVPTGCCANTPQAVTVTANPDASLAPGTFTAEIDIKSADGKQSMIVPVSLTVQHPSASFFDSLAGGLTFSLLTGGKTPPAQVVSIRNAGSGSLNWKTATETADGGKWLSLSVQSGTAPSLLSVGVDPSKLPGQGLVAGTFVGQVTLSSADSRVTIPITVTVGSSVFSQLNPLFFTKTVGGGNPAAQEITVASTGSAIRYGAAVANATGGNWLSIPTGCCANTPQAVTVTVNPDPALPAGTYTAEIIFKAADGTQASVVPVTLTVAPPSATFFDAVPGELTFSLITKGAAPPVQTLEVHNAGSGSLNWKTATETADGGKWLSLSVQSGTAPSLLSVGVDPSKLPGQGLVAGTFVGQVTLSSADSRVTIPITVTVGSSVFSQLNPLFFTKTVGGGNPAAQEITVASTGSAIRYGAAVANATGGNWLSIPTGCCANTPQAVTVTVNPDPALPAGTYTAEIIFKAADGTQASVVPVTLTVAPPSATFFDAVPGELTFSLITKGAAPPVQTLEVHNTGSGTLNWGASASTADAGGWITLSTNGGTAPSLLSVGVDPSKLPGQGLVAGTFVGQVTLSSADSRVTIPITVTVGSSVFSQLNPLFFTKTVGGGNPAAQEITVASTGSAIRYGAAVANATGGNWLSIPTGCCANTPQAVTVTVNPDPALPAGTYTAEIIFKAADGTQASVVPVTLTVAPLSATFFDALAGALTFSQLTSGPVPPTQSLHIRNAGSGALEWSASASTADAGGWVTLSASSGTAPSILSVGVDPSKLPGQGLVAGTFVGQVILRTAGDAVTVPVTFTVGTPVFVPIHELFFRKPTGGSNPPSQAITLASNGGSIRYGVTVANATGGNWLSVPTGCCADTPQTVTVNVRPDPALPSGIYTAEIIFKSADGTRASVVPVTLTVGGTTQTPTVAPVLSLASGSYTATQTLTLSDATSGAIIYYTSDGSTPTTSSTRYTGPIAVASGETIRAVAIAPGDTLSGVASATYSLVPAAVSPATLGFGSQAVGTTSAAKTITISNPGLNTLPGFTVALSGTNAADFSFTSSGCNATIRAGGSCTVPVSYSPHASGANAATLNISFNGVGSPLKVSLSGTGSAASTVLKLVPSSTTVVYGQALSIAASLSGSPAPTGTLTYAVDGGASRTVSLSGSAASLSLGIIPSGSHSIVVSYSGDASHPQTSQTLNFSVAKAVLTVRASDASRAYGSANPSFTYTVSGFVNGDTSAAISGSAALTTTAGVTSPVGSYAIALSTKALAASNYTFTYTPGTLTVTRAGQTITFNPLGGLAVGASVTLSATSSSGLPISYSVSGPVQLSGSTLTATATGSASITASQPGNGNYNPASPVTQTLTIRATAQTITFPALPSTAIYGSAGPYTLHATASSGLPVSYSVTGPATLSGSTLTITGAGTVSVTASQTGNNIYQTAQPVTQRIVVSAATVPPLVAGTISRLSDGSYQIVVTVTNSGSTVLSNVALTGVLLGAGVGSPTPRLLSTIAPGSAASAIFSVPAAAGTPASGVVERISGTYTGGTFGGSYRVTLP